MVNSKKYYISNTYEMWKLEKYEAKKRSSGKITWGIRGEWLCLNIFFFTVNVILFCWQHYFPPICNHVAFILTPNSPSNKLKTSSPQSSCSCIGITIKKLRLYKFHYLFATQLYNGIRKPLSNWTQIIFLYIMWYIDIG